MIILCLDPLESLEISADSLTRTPWVITNVGMFSIEGLLVQVLFSIEGLQVQVFLSIVSFLVQASNHVLFP